MRVALATPETELTRCFPVTAPLRSHLSKEEFVHRVRRPQQDGYRLACLKDQGGIRSRAGLRVTEMLASGKPMHVDDLATAENHRSRGYDANLFDWLIARAKADGCAQLHLDSGAHRFAAHRFYLMKQMENSSLYFCLKLDAPK